MMMYLSGGTLWWCTYLEWARYDDVPIWNKHVMIMYLSGMSTLCWYPFWDEHVIMMYLSWCTLWWCTYLGRAHYDYVSIWNEHVMMMYLYEMSMLWWWPLRDEYVMMNDDVPIWNEHVMIMYLSWMSTLLWCTYLKWACYDDVPIWDEHVMMMYLSGCTLW